MNQVAREGRRRGANVIRSENRLANGDHGRAEVLAGAEPHRHGSGTRTRTTMGSSHAPRDLSHHQPSLEVI